MNLRQTSDLLEAEDVRLSDAIPYCEETCSLFFSIVLDEVVINELNRSTMNFLYEL
jgi:hypothetical protein